MSGYSYASVDDLAAAPDLDVSALSVSRQLRLLEAASEDIDTYCSGNFRRTFQPYTGVEYVGDGDCYGRGRLYVPDFLSLTEVASDYGTGTYATVWATTDYVAYPYAAPAQRRPHIALERAYAGRYGWPYIPRGLRLTGLFGFWQRLEDTGATLAADATDSATTLGLTDYRGVSPGHTILIDSEQMYVRATAPGVGNPTMVVDRAVNGTTAAAHLGPVGMTPGATIYVYRYPAPITEACIALVGARVGGGVLVSAGVTSERVGDIAVTYGPLAERQVKAVLDQIIPASYRRASMFI